MFPGLFCQRQDVSRMQLGSFDSVSAWRTSGTFGDYGPGSWGVCVEEEEVGLLGG